MARALTHFLLALCLISATLPAHAEESQAEKRENHLAEGCLGGLALGFIFPGIGHAVGLVVGCGIGILVKK